MGILGDLGKSAARTATNTLNRSSIGSAISKSPVGAALNRLGSSTPTAPGALPTDYGNLYEWFYNTLLVTANSIPIQALWLVQIDKPTGVDVSKYENTVTDGTWNVTEMAKKNWETGKTKAPAMIFANGVQIPGDGLTVSRVGPENMGMVKGVIGNGRKELETLSMTFLETNYSFTEYNLRPWAIQVAHKSLKIRKDPAENLRTTITVINLAKNGPGEPLIPRGIWKFHGACPIDIDTQQFDYGPDRVLQRQVQFAYNYYTFEAAKSDDASGGAFGQVFDSLNKTLGQLSPENLINRAVETGIDLVTGAGQQIVTNVGGQISDAAEGLIQRGQTALRELEGKAVKAATIRGAVGESLDKLTRGKRDTPDSSDTKHQIVSPSTNDSVTRPDRGALPSFAERQLNDTPYGGKQIAGADIANEQINHPTDDLIKRRKEPLMPIAVRESSDTRSDVRPPIDDTPTYNTENDGGSQYTANLSKRGQVKDAEGNTRNTGNAGTKPKNPASKGTPKTQNKSKPGLSDTPDPPREDGPVSRTDSKSAKGAAKDATDTPLFFGPGDTGGGSKTSQSDIPSTYSMSNQNKPIDTDDITHPRSLPHAIKVVDENDMTGGGGVQLHEVVDNDTAVRDQIPLQIVSIKNNDTVKKDNVPAQLVETNAQDTVNKDNVPAQLIETNAQDTVNKDNVPAQLIETNAQDIVNKDSIPAQLIETNAQDTVNKDNIPVALIETNTQDTVNKDSIPVQLIETNKDSAADGRVIFTKEVTPSVDDRVNSSNISTQNKDVGIDDTVRQIHSRVVEVKGNDTVVGSQIPLQIVSINADDT